MVNTHKHDMPYIGIVFN